MGGGWAFDEQHGWAVFLISSSSSGHQGQEQTYLIGSLPFPKPAVPMFSLRSDKLSHMSSDGQAWAEQSTLPPEPAQGISVGGRVGLGAGGRANSAAHLARLCPSGHCRGPVLTARAHGFGRVMHTAACTGTAFLAVALAECSTVGLAIHYQWTLTWVVASLGLLSMKPTWTFLYTSFGDLCTHFPWSSLGGGLLNHFPMSLHHFRPQGPCLRVLAALPRP